MKKSLKKVKDKLFYHLVEKNKIILRKYQEYRSNNEELHTEYRFITWMYIISLNISYVIFRKHKTRENSQVKSVKSKQKPVNANSRGYRIGPCLDRVESTIVKRPPVQHFVKQLMKYDVISFDIFDTLLLRPLAKPTDLFMLLAEKHGYLEFSYIRRNEERKLRAISREKFGHSEITYEEIYDRVSKYTGIDKEEGMRIEFETELELCFANPYMKEVFEILKYNGKKIIAVSDMYLPKSLIEKLLKKCGYEGFEEIYVSCEYRCSKYDKGLYKVVDEDYTNGKTVIHIGDNYVSDVEKAEEFGWDAFYYRQVHFTGNRYRPTGMSPLIGSAYSGIVNTHMHNGIKTYSPIYEYGFIYAGLFVLGYCNFIHQYVKRNNIDKVLFLARDGYILKEVYDRLFPEDSTEYFYWSRIANTKISSLKFRYEYIYQYVTLRVIREDNLTAKEILDIMDLPELAPLLKESGFYPQQIINKKNVDLMEKFIIDNWELIEENIGRNVKAAKLYIDPIIKDCKKVCAVDIGWRGSGAMGLKSLIEDVLEYDCEVYGLLAASSKKEEESNIASMMNGTLEAYMFSQYHNKDKYHFHRKRVENNIFVELFVGATQPSFRGFKLIDDENYELLFDRPDCENYEITREIQRGILDFAEIYKDKFKNYDYMFHISGSDAYTPIAHILKDLTYVRKFLGGFTFNRTVGSNPNSDNFETIEEILIRHNIA